MDGDYLKEKEERLKTKGQRLLDLLFELRVDHPDSHSRWPTDKVAMRLVGTTPRGTGIQIEDSSFYPKRRKFYIRQRTEFGSNLILEIEYNHVDRTLVTQEAAETQRTITTLENGLFMDGFEPLEDILDALIAALESPIKDWHVEVDANWD